MCTKQSRALQRTDSTRKNTVQTTTRYPAAASDGEAGNAGPNSNGPEIQTAVCCASSRLHGVQLLLLGLSQIVELLDALVRLLLHLILHNRATTANSNGTDGMASVGERAMSLCLLPASAGADEKATGCRVAWREGGRGKAAGVRGGEGPGTVKPATTCFHPRR